MVLTGSLARGEGSWTEAGGARKALGDAEILLVFERKIPALGVVERLCREVEQALRCRGIICSIDLSPIRTTYLRSLQPHIFAYELRECGRVLWGDPNILSLIPPFSPADIPLEDGLWLLCNRMIEQLGELAPTSRTPDSPQGLHYATVKLYLDMATCLLLFAGHYVPGYRARQIRLAELVQKRGMDASWPFPLEDFSNRVAWCTQRKLGAAPGETGPSLLEESVDCARRLWQWQLQQLTGAPAEEPAELWNCWMRMQPLSRRLRGWLYVARRRGWQSTSRHWGRWIRRALIASPRLWIYSAATELFFQLPELLARSDARAAGLSRIANRLPVPRPAPAEWKETAAAIYADYREFLTGTRS